MTDTKGAVGVDPASSLAERGRTADIGRTLTGFRLAAVAAVLAGTCYVLRTGPAWPAR